MFLKKLSKINEVAEKDGTGQVLINL